jgi:hypothetical protein
MAVAMGFDEKEIVAAKNEPCGEVAMAVGPASDG